MLVRNVKSVNYKIIQKFASVYSFPPTDDIIEMFITINGGEPTSLKFFFQIDTAQQIESSVKKFLSFNKNDDDSIFDGFDMIEDNSGEIIPFAIDENENCLCYIPEEDVIKLFCIDTGEYYDICSECGIVYDLFSFLSLMDL